MYNILKSFMDFNDVTFIYFRFWIQLKLDINFTFDGSSARKLTTYHSNKHTQIKSRTLEQHHRINTSIIQRQIINSLINIRFSTGRPTFSSPSLYQ